MSDYIKREDAIERLSYHADFYQNDREFGGEEMLYKDSALNEISELPSADVVEVEKVNRIYEKLADLFDMPCNFSPCDEIMLESERCREDCGNISDAECWKRYFEVVCFGERSDT